MEGLKLEIFNWLIELDDKEAAEFLSDNCDLDNRYVDTHFALDIDSKTNMFDIIINIPLKLYSKLNDYKSEVSKIESAIKEYAQTNSIIIRNIYWRPCAKNAKDSSYNQNVEEISKIMTQEYVRNQIRLMYDLIETNPHLALEISNELIETCCKCILEEAGIKYEKDWDILKFVRETKRNVDFLPYEIENKKLAKSSITKILSDLCDIIHGLTESRDSFRTDHGHSPNFKMHDTIYIKLAVLSSSNFAVFYLSLIELKRIKAAANK